MNPTLDDAFADVVSCTEDEDDVESALEEDVCEEEELKEDRANDRDNELDVCGTESLTEDVREELRTQSGGCGFLHSWYTLRDSHFFWRFAHESDSCFASSTFSSQFFFPSLAQRSRSRKYSCEYFTQN